MGFFIFVLLVLIIIGAFIRGIAAIFIGILMLCMFGPIGIIVGLIAYGILKSLESGKSSDG